MPQVRGNVDAMSTLPGGIGPVSVRYAAQIRELLQSQAIDRMAAEEEAARNAEKAEKAERMKPIVDVVKLDLEIKPPVDAKPVTAEAPEQPAPKAQAQIVDIQV